MDISLYELGAKFIKLSPVGFTIVDSLDESQGIMFLCPKCFAKNNGSVGTHSIICWFVNRGVPDSQSPKPGRWVPVGKGLDDLTFTNPGAASIELTTGCQWHGFIKDGRAG